MALKPTLVHVLIKEHNMDNYKELEAIVRNWIKESRNA
jgi:hypothetical protein